MQCCAAMVSAIQVAASKMKYSSRQTLSAHAAVKSRREIDLTFLSKLMTLSIRPLAREDFDNFINYWRGLSQPELEHLGVASDRLPSAARMRFDLEAMLAASNDTLRTFVLAWCINGHAIGHSSLKDIVPAETGSMHLHMWCADLRGKGYGGYLFCLAAIDFYERFKLKRIICEPKADNPSPNRLLQKIGFPRVATRIGRSSELSTICKLNRYDIAREIAEHYLLARSSRIIDRETIGGFASPRRL
jgi:RimJ/RimL family protein N-acetyltransferase